MKQLSEKNNASTLFLWCYIVWIFLLSAMVSLYNKGDAFLVVNHFRYRPLDLVCSMATYIGDGLFSLLMVAVLIIMKRRKTAWIILASFLLSGLICLLLKRMINEPRPIAYFPDPRQVLGVKWMPFSKSHGFPSGHTTSAFAIACAISLSVAQKWAALLSFFLACLVGYSRIYLGQHFVGDILAGSIIGGVSGYWCTLKSHVYVIKHGFGLEYLYKKKWVHDSLS